MLLQYELEKGVGHGKMIAHMHLQLVLYLEPSSFGGNGATIFFLVFALLAAVLGIVSKLAGGNHLRAWRKDSQAAAGSLSLVSWAVTALALGLACKEINMGGHRGWRLRVVEAFIIVLAFTQLLYVLALHSGVFSISYGTYYDTDFGLPGPTNKDPVLSAGTAPTLLE
ncbi:hypothetical protein LguiA_030459 [Lonicera macranthoides]